MKDKFIGVCKVGEKGQIVIPKDAREMFGISPGDMLVCLCDIEKGIAFVKASSLDGVYDKVLNFDKKGKDN